jgi:hypothetical protein
VLVQYLVLYSWAAVGAWSPIHALGAAESRTELTSAYWRGADTNKKGGLRTFPTQTSIS